MPSANKWALFTGIGILLILLGFIAAIDAVFVTLASTIFIGALLIVAGIMQGVHAFAVRDWGGFLFSLLGGALYVVAGVVLIKEPVSGSVALTLFAAICFVVIGVIRAVMALQHRELQGWGIVLGSGLISLLVGLCLYFTLPWSALWLIGTFVAIELMASGIGWLQFGLALRRMGRVGFPQA
ncbi:MAG: DUF308 domain-containing protein [Acetobacter sp.]|uniref:HdeD family acid-resistance protein n=1 Tax=Acetobacter sp. TaxID=440 RepID=UPI0039ECFA08